jgi:hypothetical protein
MLFLQHITYDNHFTYRVTIHTASTSYLFHRLVVLVRANPNIHIILDTCTYIGTGALLLQSQYFVIFQYKNILLYLLTTSSRQA